MCWLANLEASEQGVVCAHELTASLLILVLDSVEDTACLLTGSGPDNIRGFSDRRSKCSVRIPHRESPKGESLPFNDKGPTEFVELGPVAQYIGVDYFA